MTDEPTQNWTNNPSNKASNPPAFFWVPFLAMFDLKKKQKKKNKPSKRRDEDQPQNILQAEEERPAKRLNDNGWQALATAICFKKHFGDQDSLLCQL